MTKQEMHTMIKNRLTEALVDTAHVEQTIDKSFTAWFLQLVNKGVQKAPPPQPAKKPGGEGGAGGGGEAGGGGAAAGGGG